MVAPAYRQQLSFIRAPYCARCAMPFSYRVGEAGANDEALICGGCIDHPPHYARGRSALLYDDASRRLILRFKHGDQHQAVRAFTPWMMAAGRDVVDACDLIVPVPLHRWRLLKRRYNQSAMLAVAIGRTSAKDVCLDAILRTRSTPPQGHMARDDRAQNVKGAFTINPQRTEAVRGKNILLIDDVMTTGATLNACTDTLMDAGAKNVDVLTIARVARHR